MVLSHTYICIHSALNSLPIQATIQHCAGQQVLVDINQLLGGFCVSLSGSLGQLYAPTSSSSFLTPLQVDTVKTKVFFLCVCPQRRTGRFGGMDFIIFSYQVFIYYSNIGTFFLNLWTCHEALICLSSRGTRARISSSLKESLPIALPPSISSLGRTCCF